jgi:hypothetical protein
MKASTGRMRRIEIRRRKARIKLVRKALAAADSGFQRFHLSYELEGLALALDPSWVRKVYY